MRNRALVYSVAFVLTPPVLNACGGISTDEKGTAGSGGTAGVSGTAGSAGSGTSGSSGNAGSSGSAGGAATGGYAGSAAIGGYGGSSGYAGSAATGGYAGSAGSSAGSGGAPDCQALISDLNTKLEAAQKCCPFCDSVQCTTAVPGLCCKQTVNYLQTPGTQAYLDAYQSFQESGCDVACPAVVCLVAPSYKCVPQADGSGRCE